MLSLIAAALSLGQVVWRAGVGRVTKIAKSPPRLSCCAVSWTVGLNSVVIFALTSYICWHANMIISQLALVIVKDGKTHSLVYLYFAPVVSRDRELLMMACTADSQISRKPGTDELCLDVTKGPTAVLCFIGAPVTVSYTHLTLPTKA